MSAAFYEDDSTAGEQDLSFREAVRRLWPLLAEHKRRLAICLGLLVAATGASLAWPWLVQQAIDGPIPEQLARPESQRVFRGVMILGVWAIALQMFAVALQYFQRVQLEIIGQDIMLGLRKRLFRHVLSLDVEFFDRNPVGRLMSRVESDTESLRLLFTNTVVLVVSDILLMTGIWAILFITEPRIAAATFVLVPVGIGVLWIFHRVTTARFLTVRKLTADVTATITELFHGMSEIQIFHRGAWARRVVYDVNRKKFGVHAKAEIAVSVFFNILFFLEYVKIGLVLLLGAAWGVTPGTMVLFILLIWKEFEPIARTAEQLSSFQKGVAGARRVFGLLAVEAKIREPETPKRLERFRNAIRFESVWFSYSNDANWVLRDVTFDVPIGSNIALAGVTGGGKTTVLSLLLRFYDPQRGRITIDGIDIREIALTDLRRCFGMVLQDIVLFPGNVAANLALNDHTVDKQALIRAATTVDAHRFIQRLPKGYETEISEKGANFSRGERQLLSFARAIVHSPDVLVLDEATASVDPETERVVQRALRKLMTGRTSIVIAHRLSTIIGADRILVLRHGELVEQGTHTELVAANGYYAKLFALQFGGQFDGEEVVHDAV